MTCSNCGAENPTDKRFCGDCGVALATTCPSCGAAVPPGKRFCGDCGAAVGGEPVIRSAATPGTSSPGAAAPGAAWPAGGTPPAARATLEAATGTASARANAPAEAERRLVTVLFADLVGFTPFAEERDAEDVRETLTRYFDLASDVIARYGGTVEKFIGDAVMALWGAPLAREDDAERAVRAGLELVDAVRALGPSIQLRAGVLTGEAAVTLHAANQGMVAGDLVNTAARLQAVAQPGTVLVGEGTYRSASKAIAFEEAGEQALKGKTAPVPAWRALRVVAQRGGRNRSETLEAPFVGRDDELRLLKELFHATAREGRLRLVSVIGPAGIGKSRLAWEFLKYADGLVETVLWHDGRSPAYGDGITFWALGEMVRGRCGLLESDDEATTRAKVAETLDRYVPDADERRWIEPALLALLGLDTGATGSEQLFAAWRTFFERLAASAPVVLVFEDLHFADGGLIDFIEHLLDWSRGAPIYVLTLARPELIDKRPAWGAGKRNFHSIYLEPLAEPAMRELLRGLVPGLPEAAARAIVARAEGIPLYAVETIRMLVAEGRIALRDGAYVPTGDLATLAVPESLTALIGARLDGLEPADRSLMQDAAVLGQSFTPAGLAAVTGLEPAALEVRLRGLVRREMLSLEADPRSPERGQYAFVQALIREVAYNTLARRDRKVRHLAAARYFEALGTEELAGALAGHYLAAHANAAEGPEADALAAQARIALSGAADRAAALGSHDQALVFLEQALSVAGDPGERAPMLERMAHSAIAAAHYLRAEGFAQEAIGAREAVGDRDGAAIATSLLASAMIGGRRLDESLPILEAALADDDQLGVAARATLLATLSRAYMRTRRHREAVEAGDRALSLAEPLQLDRIVAEALVNKGSALENLARLHEATALLRAAIALANTLGMTELEIRARNNLAAALFLDDPLATYEMGLAALELAERVGDRGMANWLRWGGSGSRFSAARDWDGWMTSIGELLGGDLDERERAAFLGASIQFRAARGDLVDDDLATLAGLIASITDPALRGTLLYVRGLCELARGDLAKVIETAHESLAAESLSAVALGIHAASRARAAASVAQLTEGMENHPLGRRRLPRSAILRGRAGLAALEGRPAEALTLYRQTLRADEELGQVFDLALTAIDMAAILDPSLPEVRAAGQKAREILSGVRATPFLEQLEQAMTRPTPVPSPATSAAGLPARPAASPPK